MERYNMLWTFAENVHNSISFGISVLYAPNFITLDNARLRKAYSQVCIGCLVGVEKAIAAKDRASVVGRWQGEWNNVREKALFQNAFQDWKAWYRAYLEYREGR